MSLYELARNMGLGVGIAEELFQRLRKDQLCQVTGINGDLHRFTTTSAGKTRALELMAHNQYVGPAPVSLEDYIGRTHAQSVRSIQITPSDLGHAFDDLVLDIRVLNQLGTAISSGRALFLYGPSGTGKTTIAETLMHLFENDPIWLPYAVEVDSQIITVYDAVVHKRVEQAPAAEQDGRWVLCRRPRLMVGGELTIEMLDLQFNPSTKFYNGPVQMKANNGLLVVDDFGRQRVSPEELLNRWVVPLDRRIDFLSLAGGKKIQIPFDLLVVFATNLDPAKMMDEAFLRRIQTKIKVDFVSPEQFLEIFRRVCAQFKLKYDASVADDLIQLISTEYKEPLRACYPRDIVQQILWKSQYLQKKPQVDRVAITQACQNYFLSL
jgi:predicted ATPase with chaperone activity